jgi:RNA polymerase sigma-70 factor (ECF subfamily)
MLSKKDYSDLADNELIEAYRRSQDTTIVGVLYNRYMTLVYGVCLKYLKDRDASKDAVMQIFEKLIKSLREHEIAHFKSWLYTTAKNHCLMAIRAQKGRIFQEFSADIMENGGIPHPEDEPEMESNLVKLEKCMEHLATEQKHCVKLFYLQHKCYKEIVQITGFDDNKVKSYIQNGKRNLKLCMEKNE